MSGVACRIASRRCILEISEGMVCCEQEGCHCSCSGEASGFGDASGSTWGVTHDGMKDLQILAGALGLGASAMRVGFEDSFYSRPARLRPLTSNW